ncbi:unnamed protein product [Polarella glacialis]|uniref:Solute carrier family 40 protein n=1 Tax=Polarella glacialis TaxID=89957 RepID=A0A813EVM8_POLGL|nr:unnamed protein product [Polarella glacialis]
MASSPRQMPRDLQIIATLSLVLSLQLAMQGPFVQSLVGMELSSAANFALVCGVSGPVGSFALTRVSQVLSRRTTMQMTLACYVLISAISPSNSDVWVFVANVVCLGGLGSVSLPLIEDYMAHAGASEEEAAAWTGKLQLVMAAAGILGPVLGPWVFPGLWHVQVFNFVGAALVSPLALLLQSPAVSQPKEKAAGLLSSLRSAECRTGAALGHLSGCFAQAFVQQLCSTIFGPSFTERFQPGASMWGQMQCVSALGSVSGYVAAGSLAPLTSKLRPKHLIAVGLLLACCWRMVQLQTLSFPLLLLAAYASSLLEAFIVPVKSTVPGQLVPQDKLQQFQGLLGTAELLSGVAGPAAASWARLSPLSPGFLLACGSIPVFALLGLPESAPESKQAKQD